MWGTSKESRFTPKNVLSDQNDFSNATHANFWLAKKEKVEGEGFVMKVANFVRKVVGVKMKNIDRTKSGNWATDTFTVEGSLLKEPEVIITRSQGHTWTSQILADAGTWDNLLTKMMKPRNQSEANPPVETFYFSATTEVRYLWFHLLSFHGIGGGLQYFNPILQSGELHNDICFNCIFIPLRCVLLDQLDKL